MMYVWVPKCVYFLLHTHLYVWFVYAMQSHSESKIERTGVELDQIGGMYFMWNIIKMSHIIKFAVICGTVYKLKD